MIIAITLILSGLLAWMGLRKGVFIMAATCFNLLVAVYLGVLSTPMVLKTIPELEASGYFSALCMLLLIFLCFLLLEGVCYCFFFRGTDIVFPPLFDKIGGGLLGFVSGYVLAGVLILAICMMPFARLDFIQKFCPCRQMESFSSRTTSRVCRFIGYWSIDYPEDTPSQTIRYLIDLGQKPAESETDPADIQPPSDLIEDAL